MENKQTEIDNVVAGFTAVVMGLITHYRGKRDALNQVPQFCEAVEREQARMDRKFEAMLNDLSFAGLEHELRNAQHRVNQYAEAEKARALAGNTVDFDTLASAIRESGQGLAKAVSKMDTQTPRNRRTVAVE